MPMPTCICLMPVHRGRSSSHQYGAYTQFFDMSSCWNGADGRERQSEHVYLSAKAELGQICNFNRVDRCQKLCLAVHVRMNLEFRLHVERPFKSVFTSRCFLSSQLFAASRAHPVSLCFYTTAIPVVYFHLSVFLYLGILMLVGKVCKCNTAFRLAQA